MIRIACVCVFHGFYFFVNCDRQKQVDPDFTHETRVEKMVEWVTKAHEVRARGLRSWDDRQLSTMIYIMYKCVFLALRHFFLFRPRVFLPDTTAQVWALAVGPWHVLWGFEVACPHGE